MDPFRKAVLVTGCSSGIGEAVARYLSGNGFVVFATVRKVKDYDRLLGLNNPTLIPVHPVDMANAGDIRHALEFVVGELSRIGCSLYAIVNNAGGGTVAPLEVIDPEILSVEFRTRVVGPVSLLQGFLPLIREAHGRVLWITTPALIPVPFVSSIHACDFAVNCIARTLRLELAPWKIPNIMIRCGGIQTAAPDRNVRELEDAFLKWPVAKSSLYRNALRAQQREWARFDLKRTPPVKVAEVVYKALVARSPRRRYSVGHLAKAASVIDYLPQAAIDMLMAIQRQ